MIYYNINIIMNTNKIIMKQFEKYNKDPLDNLTIEPPDDIFNWKFILVGPKDTPWENEIFSGTIKFPMNYPFSPPNVKFTSKIFHPNIYNDGKICISILHEGKDQYGYEDSSERWSPVQTIQTIFLSILTLFHDPNCDSPANVDASVMYRRDKLEFIRYVRNLTK